MTPEGGEKLHARRESGVAFSPFLVQTAKSDMMLIAGPAAVPIPPRRLPLALTGPNDQRRESTNKRQPNDQQKDHIRILLSASSEGPGLTPGFPV